MNPINNLKIIYYHTVSDTPLSYFPTNRTINLETFRKQIKLLKKFYKVISLREAVHMYENKEKFSNHLVITTDDGMKENYTYMAPVFMEEKITHTMLLIDDVLDNKILMWRNILFYIKKNINPEKSKNIMNSLAEEFSISKPNNTDNLMSWSLREWRNDNKDCLAQRMWDELINIPVTDFLDEHKPYLTSDQVRELLSAGFDIGSHTKSHSDCSKLTEGEIESEIIGSAKSLSEKYNVDVNLFSFPFGRPPKRRVENYLKENFPGKIKTVLGIRDILKNNTGDPTYWERISMEFNYPYSMFKFFIVPIKDSLKSRSGTVKM